MESVANEEAVTWSRNWEQILEGCRQIDCLMFKIRKFRKRFGRSGRMSELLSAQGQTKPRDCVQNDVKLMLQRFNLKGGKVGEKERRDHKCQETSVLFGIIQ